MKKGYRARNYTFTWFNYPGDWLDILCKLEYLRYIVAGEEVCPSTNTRHLQGYIEFTTKVDWNVLLNCGITHIEQRRGTAQEAAEYCKKDGMWYDHGVISEQGQRTDLNSLATSIMEGKTIGEVAIDYPTMFIRFHKGIQALKMITIQPRDTVPTVTVIWGPTGSGKSRLARILVNENYYEWGPEQERWFDGYEGQSDVIFEEFRGQLPFGMILRLLDRYECRVQYKGGSCQFAATNIIMTSPKHPSYWYQDDGHDKTDQLLRRITVVKELKNSQNPLP